MSPTNDMAPVPVPVLAVTPRTNEPFASPARITSETIAGAFTRGWYARSMLHVPMVGSVFHGS